MDEHLAYRSITTWKLSWSAAFFCYSIAVKLAMLSESAVCSLLKWSMELLLTEDIDQWGASFGMNITHRSKRRSEQTTAGTLDGIERRD